MTESENVPSTNSFPKLASPEELLASFIRKEEREINKTFGDRRRDSCSKQELDRQLDVLEEDAALYGLENVLITRSSRIPHLDRE